MSDQDRYIPGVPCWVDTTQPDPEAAVAFYGELFGWEFEDVMPPGAPGHVLHRPAPRRRRRAPSARRRRARRRRRSGTRTSGSTDADETAGKVRAAGGRVLMEPMRRRGRRAHGRVRRPGRRRVLGLAARAAPRRHGRQRARLAELQRPPHARPRRRARVLRRGVRLGAARHRRPADAWALPAYGDFLEQRTPGMRENMAEHGRARRASRRSWRAWPDSDDEPDAARTGASPSASTTPTRSPRAPPSSAARWSCPPFDAPWVADDGHRRPAGRDVHGQQVRAGEQGRGAAGGRGRGVMRVGRAPQAAPAPCSAIQSRVSMSQNASPAYSR